MLLPPLDDSPCSLVFSIQHCSRTRIHGLREIFQPCTASSPVPQVSARPADRRPSLIPIFLGRLRNMTRTNNAPKHLRRPWSTAKSLTSGPKDGVARHAIAPHALVRDRDSLVGRRLPIRPLSIYNAHSCSIRESLCTAHAMSPKVQCQIYCMDQHVPEA